MRPDEFVGCVRVAVEAGALDYEVVTLIDEVEA